MNIYGQKVMLRAIESEDMELLRETINDPDTEHMVGGWSFPVSRSQQMRWYESTAADSNTVRLMIELIESHQTVGMIYLADIDWKSRQASYGIKLMKNAPHGQGIATDSELTLFSFAFEEMGLHRLNGEVVDYNTASIIMTERCGAKREGIKRKALYKAGEYHDVICYGLLYEDYLEAKKALNWHSSYDRKL